ncbi:SIMPL domain-containing protein [Asticcacaulis sp. AND118]|uniref:SIMPL domain-containing protein n=1 Tax=Asticcacaulis sp. AND118 TaxID=2840468 RepID=UPI001CFFBFE5|nr:SIMPL domain-containing protein [Asticcacaulis sp. AND118]UDF03074.1 SIMPL domain-containing protein [Asticcacaulis sp. AND118]
MRKIVIGLALAGLGLSMPALAQTSTPAASGYDKAPWWMKEAVITQTGYVRTEIEANRASFSASFLAVGKTADEAQQKAVAQTRALTDALKKLGKDAVRVNTSFSMRVLYEQYRDKEGNRIENQRGDKIEAYQVNMGLDVKVYDVRTLERAYALVLAASPTASQPVYFSLEPDNATKTWLYTEAVKDAARRARQAAEAAGAKLGSVKVIDPTGRACQTDILARGEPSGGQDNAPTTVAYDRVEYASPPPPAMAAPAPGGSAVEQLEAKAAQNAFIQAPPLNELTAQACVVYGLN